MLMTALKAFPLSRILDRPVFFLKWLPFPFDNVPQASWKSYSDLVFIIYCIYYEFFKMIIM